MVLLLLLWMPWWDVKGIDTGNAHLESDVVWGSIPQYVIFTNSGRGVDGEDAVVVVSPLVLADRCLLLAAR